MIKNVLTDIGGISLYGVVSICIFIGVFLLATLRMALLKKSDLEGLGKLPLEDGTETNAQRPSNLNPN